VVQKSAAGVGIGQRDLRFAGRVHAQRKWPCDPAAHPPIKGKRLKKLSAVLKDPKVHWQRGRISLW
jgi:hypothetical protein